MHASECLQDPSTLRELNLDSFPLLVVHTLWRGMQIYAKVTGILTVMTLSMLVIGL